MKEEERKSLINVTRFEKLGDDKVIIRRRHKRRPYSIVRKQSYFGCDKCDLCDLCSNAIIEGDPLCILLNEIGIIDSPTKYSFKYER